MTALHSINNPFNLFIMPIYTEGKMRHELSNNGSLSLPMVKDMMRILLEINDRQANQIRQLKFEIEMLGHIVVKHDKLLNQ